MKPFGQRFEAKMKDRQRFEVAGVYMGLAQVGVFSETPRGVYMLFLFFFQKSKKMNRSRVGLNHQPPD